MEICFDVCNIKTKPTSCPHRGEFLEILDGVQTEVRIIVVAPEIVIILTTATNDGTGKHVSKVKNNQIDLVTPPQKTIQINATPSKHPA